MPPTLCDPPFYFPLRHGRYEIAPGLKPFGKDLGGGAADGRVFQIDRTFGWFREAKLASRAEKLERYFCTSNLRDEVTREVNRFILERLVREHPEHFEMRPFAGATGLTSHLTGEELTFSSNWQLDDERYASALDALACQVQEDLAIISANDERHWLSAVHVCLPNGWAPAEKVGHVFGAIHEPVAGMAEMNRRGDEFAHIMIGAEAGLVRFAWGVAFDDRLNHHPDLPRSPFDEANPRAFLRVERQTIWGLPAVRSALFTIRTYLYDCDRLRRDAATREPLVAALASMPVESQAYKGLEQSMARLLEWLRG